MIIYDYSIEQHGLKYSYKRRFEKLIKFNKKLDIEIWPDKEKKICFKNKLYKKIIIKKYFFMSNDREPEEITEYNNNLIINLGNCTNIYICIVEK